ncbi:1468_t:CDS:2, partial [Funneliformis geosporum]
GEKPDKKEARKWNDKQSKEVGGTSINIYQPNFLDDLAILYDKLISGINTARENKMNCLMFPLCWGIVDLRAENISPCPNHPRAKEFLSDIEVGRLHQLAKEIVNEESRLNPSAMALIEALQYGTFSLKKLSKEKRARGILGIFSLLKIKSNVDIYDKDTQHVGECMDSFDSWVRIYGGSSHIERTVDMHLVGPFSKVPGVKFIYGESHSDADRNEKSSRCQSDQPGKACDFIFLENGHEIGIGENTGPTHKDHYKKSVTDFVDVIKVAQAQHISFQTKCIEESGCSPLPSNIQNALILVSIPFFHVIGMKIRFYILIQINGDLYGMWEWSSQDLPKKEGDIIAAVALSKKFLIHRNLLNRTSRLSQTAIKNSQIFRDNVENMQFVQNVKRTVKLSSITTQKAKKGRNTEN